MARVTSQDVAREAGVSQTTVSFVLNGRTDHGISERTRQAVLEAIDRLGYVPSGAARSLRSGQSTVVLCALPPLTPSQSVEEFKQHLSQVLRENGYTCVFVHAGPETGPLQEVWRDVHPAAVLALATLEPGDAAALDRAGIPVVDGALDPDRSDVVALDQEAIGYVQVRELAARGHRVVGYGWLDNPLELPFCGPRLAGARRACVDLGLSEPVVAELSYTRESARAALEVWRGAEPRVTAVAAFNDLVAVSVMAACRSTGVSVPADLAVVGVDDLPVGSLVEPALSTISLDLRAGASTLAAYLLEKLPGDRPGARVPEPSTPTITFVDRESV